MRTVSSECAVIHAAELLVFLTAFGAWPRAWRWIGFTFFLFVVGTVQIFLLPSTPRPVAARPGCTASTACFALVVAVIAAIIAHRGMRDLGLKRGRSADVGGAPPPPLP